MPPHEGDLDLVLLGSDTAGACELSSCIDASNAVGLAPEQLTLTAVRGAAYYIVVDGIAGASSTFTLDVDCAKQ